MPWSAWQPGFDYTAPAAYQDSTGAPSDLVNAVKISSPATGAGYADLAGAIADVPTLFATAAAPTGDLDGTSADGWEQTFQATDSIDPPDGITAGVTLTQWYATFLDPANPPPDPPIPPGATSFEYEGDPTRLGWDDWSLSSADNFGTENSSLSDVQTATTETTTYFDDWTPYTSFRLVDPATLDYQTAVADEVAGMFPAATCWPAAGVGVEADRVTPALTTAGPTDTTTATISLTAASDDESFTIVIQPSSIIDNASPTVHAPSTSGADTVRNGTASDVFVGPGRFLPFPPNIRFVTSRWRYFIDDAVYTVGGHWATPGGVQVMSLKADGVTWIPVVDGLAPPLI